MNAPATLDHAGIAARIPHHGAMCLLARLQSWDAGSITCSASSHRDAANPLLSNGVLWAPCAIEYAAQAMALHGALLAPLNDAQAEPAAGFLASARSVRLCVARLDTVPSDLTVTAQRLAGDATQALYAFALHDAGGALLVDGRATVVLRAATPPGGKRLPSQPGAAAEPHGVENWLADGLLSNGPP